MRTSLRLLAFLTLGLLVAAQSGCTAKQKKDRYLKKADSYLADGDYAKAEIEYRNALRLDPVDPRAIGQLGLIYVNQGRMSRVFPFLSKAAELEPNNLEIRLRLGQFYAGIGRAAEAKEQANFVLGRNPQDKEAPLLLAEIAMRTTDIEDTRQRLKALPSAQGAPVLLALGALDLRERKLKEAEAYFEQAQKLEPKSATVVQALATLYAAQNDLPKAEATFKQAAELAPARSAIRIRYAQFCLVTRKFDLARQTLEEITQKTPDYLPAWMLRANIAATEQKFDESLVSLGKVLASDPLHLEAIMLSARVRLAKGDKDASAAELERALKVYPQMPLLHQQVAGTYLALGDLGKAAASLTQAVTLAPNLVEAAVQLAEVNIRQGNHLAAVAALTQIVKEHPELVPPRLLLAQAYRGQNKPNEAFAVYRLLEEHFPKSPQAPTLTGMLHLEQRRRDEARRSFTKALEIESDYLPAVEQLVNLDMTDKKYGDAKQRLNGLITKNPKAAEPQLLLARVLLAESDTRQAEAALLKVIELQPESPVGYYLLARLYVSSKEEDKALANLRQAAAKNPREPAPLLTMAGIHEQRKEYDAARDNYEKVIVLNPRSGAALNNLAYLYAERFNQIDKARELAQQARERFPSEPHIADTLGWIVHRKGEYPYALTLLTESAEKLPTLPDVQYHLGMTHYMLGEEAPARAALEKALGIGTDFIEAESARRALSILAIDPKGGVSAEARATLDKAVAERVDPIALARLGAMHEKAGDLDKAATAYESALKASSSNVNAMLSLVRVLKAQKKNPRALEVAQTAYKVAPGNPEVTHALGRLVYDSGDRNWAASLLQETARKLPDNPAVLFDMAEATYSLGQVGTAETALNKALETNPLFPQAAKARGFLEMVGLAGDGARALAASGKIEQALSANPDDVPALAAKGRMLVQKLDLAGARTTYEKVLTLFPEFTPAKRQLAILYSQSPADDTKAAAMATQARAAFPNDAELAKALGIITFRQGAFPRALNFLQESARERTTDAELHYYLGLTQSRLKNLPASTQALQRALELGLRAELADEAKKILATSG